MIRADKYPILGLDLATVTGWALLLGPETAVISATKKLPGAEMSMGRFLQVYRDWLLETLIMYQVSKVFFEAPLPANRQSQEDTARKLMGLALVTELVCHDTDILPTPCPISAVKRHLTGDGTAKKSAMVDGCRALGFNPKDHNEADALAVMIFGVAKIDPPTHARRFFIAAPQNVEGTPL